MLSSTGIDLVTWAPTLKELTKLEDLDIRYRPWAEAREGEAHKGEAHEGELETHDGEPRHQSRKEVRWHQAAEATLSTHGVLEKILEPLLGRLISLNLDLKFPGYYRWGAFERLQRLRVPAAGFLHPSNWDPSDRASGKMVPMIPASLFSLTLVGFTPAGGSHVPASDGDGLCSGCGCGQEFALICFLDEIGTKDVQEARKAKGETKLMNVTVVLRDGATAADVSPFPKRIAQRSKVRLMLQEWNGHPEGDHPEGDHPEGDKKA